MSRQKSVIPLILMGVGAVSLYAAYKKNNSLNGLGRLRLSMPKLSNITRSIARAVRRKKVGDAATAAQAGEVIEYQDENGNVITEAEYNRRQALYLAQVACRDQGRTWDGAACLQPAPAVLPPPELKPPGPAVIFQPRKDFTDQPQAAVVNQPAPSSVIQPPGPSVAAPQSWQQMTSGGGGQMMTDSREHQLLPSVESAPTPTFADQAAPAPEGKINPLVTLAAFAAVPVIFGLTGGK